MKLGIELNHKTLGQPVNVSGNHALERPRVGATAWFSMSVAVGLTFLAFMTLDPQPSLLLATCSALNVGIILLAIYRLYEWELLLSPLAAAVIGPGWLIYYSIGNLGARIAGETRYGSNPGSLEFYPLAALLSTIGLVVFYLVGFVLLERQARFLRIRYADLYWQPWQALFASLVATGILVYLSLKYPFINGYFQDVQGQLDRALSATHYFFVILAVIVGVSVLNREKAWLPRLYGYAGIFLPLLTALGLRSRTFMVAVSVTLVLCWITLRPRQAGRALLVGLIVIVLLFALGTVVKDASSSGQTSSILENLVVVFSSDLGTLTQLNTNSASIDYQYRMAGFEFPAAMVSSLMRGNSPMYGAGIFEGLIASLPSMIRPAGELSERQAILRHYFGRGLYYGDSIGIPLTSGLADWGLVLGPLIYALIAIYCVLVWRVVQVTPTLFVAYLISGASPGDLFWDDALFAIRAIGFTVFVLILIRPLVMPRWKPASPPPGISLPALKPAHVDPLAGQSQ